MGWGLTGCRSAEKGLWHGGSGERGRLILSCNARCWLLRAQLPPRHGQPQGLHCACPPPPAPACSYITAPLASIDGPLGPWWSSLGGLVDSAYEYMLKMWVLSGKQQVRAGPAGAWWWWCVCVWGGGGGGEGRRARGRLDAPLPPPARPQDPCTYLIGPLLLQPRIAPLRRSTPNIASLPLHRSTWSSTRQLCGASAGTWCAGRTRAGPGCLPWESC